MRIAVASSDGKVVNQHFGKAGRFLIYDVQGDTITYRETRENAPACGGGGEGEGHDEDALARAIALISDCEAVICARIGMGAYDELLGHGILPFEARDLIEPAIRTYLNYKRAVERVDERGKR